MKVMVDTHAILDAVQIATGILPMRSTMPMLQNVKMSIDDDGGRVQATDLEVGLTQRFPVGEIAEKGTISVPGARLLQVLREIKDDHVGLESKGNHCVVKIAAGEFKLLGSDPDEFPQVPEDIEGDREISVDATLFSEMTKRTIIATGVEDPRFQLSGMLVIATEGSLEMVATDGKRLGHTKSTRVSGMGEFRVIIPGKTLRLLTRIQEPTTEKIRVKISENRILFRTSRATVLSRLMEGNFPDYARVLPGSAYDKVAHIARVDFWSYLKAVSTLTDERSRAVKMSFEPRLLTLSAQSQEAGQSRIEMPIEFSSSRLDIAFNPGYIAEVLGVIDGEKVTFLLKDSASAGVLRSEKENLTFTYIVMPIAFETE